MAQALKAEIGKGFAAAPLPGPAWPDDWTATDGALDLEVVAQAAIDAQTAALAEAGYVIVPRDPTNAADLASGERYEMDEDGVLRAVSSPSHTPAPSENAGDPDR